MSRHAVTVRAPGKLFLMGEYAVLYGAPAIVQAVDRYVEVSGLLQPEASTPAITVESLGATLPSLSATWTNEVLTYTGVKPEHALVIALLNALCEQGVLGPHVGNLKLSIDSRQLFHQGNKLGLGSSAAVSHALVNAVSNCVAEQTGSLPSLPEHFVFDVHQAFQHGHGSGADLAAGILGGTFWYRQTDPETRYEADLIQVPDRLKYAYIWVGKPASTSKALVTLSDYRHQHPRAFERALAPLLALAKSAVGAMATGQAERFVRDCEAYGHNLSEFGRTVGIDIVSQAHRSLRDLAKKLGVVYKPSGAGNGDFGVAYSIDIKALQNFESVVEDEGFTVVPLGPGRSCHQI